MYTTDLFKEIEDLFLAADAKQVKAFTKIDPIKIGKLRVKTPERKFTIDLGSVTGRHIIPEAAIVTGFGLKRTMICFESSFLTSIRENENHHVLRGVCAHEVGHYLSGHLTKTGRGKSYLNVNREDQKFLFAEHTRLSTRSSYQTYKRCVFLSLLKGGCDDRELEADIQALNFVSITDMIMTHMSGILTASVFSRIETSNRIKWLMKHLEENGQHNTNDGYELKIVFD